MFEQFGNFSTMNVDEITKTMNENTNPPLANVVEPIQNLFPPSNSFDFPQPKPEVKIEDFYPEAEVYVGLLNNGVKWGLPVLLKKVYNLPTEEQCEHQFLLHKQNYERFLQSYEQFNATAESEQDELQKLVFERTKSAYEEANRVWEMYPLIKKAVEQKGLDEGENRLLKKALATWLYQNRDKVQNPLITIAVVLASSIGTKFAELELTGAKQFRPLVVDESVIKQRTEDTYEPKQDENIEVIEPANGGGLPEQSTTE